MRRFGGRSGQLGWRGACLRRGGRPWLGWLRERRASLHQAQGAGDQARQVWRGHGAVEGVTVGVRDPCPDRFLGALGGPRGRRGDPEPQPVQGYRGARGADSLVEEAPEVIGVAVQLVPAPLLRGAPPDVA